MILKPQHRLLIVLAVLASSVSLYAAETFTHQGRLLDASDVPVTDGFYAATFSLWDDPLAGTQVWSEPQDIETKDGLFSAELGRTNSFFDIFTEYADGDLYLQVQVLVSGSPETLSPRLLISSVPSALTSRKVHGLHHGSGASALSRCLVAATDSGAVAYLDDDSDGDGVPESSSALSSSPSGVIHKFTWNQVAGPVVNSASVACDDASSSVDVSADLDGDGLADRRVSEDCDDTDASVSLTSSPPGGGGGGGGGGGAVLLVTDDASSSAVVARDLDLDGALDVVVSSSCDATSAKHAINTKGTGANTGRVSSVSSTTDESSASVACAVDFDGDGLDDSETFLRISPTTTSLAIKTKGTGAQRFSAGTDCDDNDARDYLDCDDDGDGIPESQLEARCTPDSVVQIAQIGDGTSSSSYSMRTRINELETILKNIGLLETSRATQACDETSAGVSCDIDSDNDGFVDRYAWQKVDNSDAVVEAAADVDHDGLPDVGASMIASATFQEFFGYFQKGDVPTQSQFSTLLDATGARSLLSGGMSGSTTGTIRTQATPDSAVSVLDHDSDGDGVPEGSVSQSADVGGVSLVTTAGSKNIGLYASDVSGQCNLLMVDGSLGTQDTTIVIDGALKRFGIGVSQPEYPLHHSSGAHLTVGGVWTNASDENLKENFRPVDGEEILEKIDDLPITQWNYKNESDEVTHIGPTAQDFKAVFGVGENDKSISTIDPSGIALAAVKELRKENQELKAQVAELKKLVEEIARKK